MNEKKQQIFFYILSILTYIIFSIISAYLIYRFKTNLSISFILISLPHIAQLAVNLIAFKNYEIIDFKAKYIPTMAILTILTTIAFALFDINHTSLGPASVLDKIIMVLVVFIITPLQASNEEFSFRIIPSLYLKKYTPIITSVIFALMHMANPESAGQNQIFFFAYFFTTAFFFCKIGMRLNNFAPSILIHSITNIFALGFVSYKNIVVETNTIFVLDKTPKATDSIIVSITIFLLIYLVIYRYEKKTK